MNTFTFIIGSCDDFVSLDELIEHYDTGGGEYICQCASYEFDAPEGCDQDTVVMIGRGMAFSSGWTMDDTFSTVIRGTLEE